MRIHYLFEIDVQRFLEGNPPAPAWVAESLKAAPFVVVRRGPAARNQVPVGVRGAERHQRWGGSCDPRWVRRIVTPAALLNALSRLRVDSIPAMRSLAILANHESWKTLAHIWGPGGSVGFELATGHPTAKPASDLDVVLYVDGYLSVEDAEVLHATTKNLPAAVDVRVEAPLCGFSLSEYASRAPPMLLRTNSGVVLGKNPWHPIRS